MSKIPEIDAIDWSRLPNELQFIPTILYQILEEENKNKVDKAIDVLLEAISRESDVYYSTLLVSKALIQLGNKQQSSHIGNIFYILSRINFERPLQSDLHMEVYQVICSDLSLYKHFLGNSNKELRSSVSRILSKAVLDINEISFWLVEQIKSENNENLRIEMWNNFSRLLVTAPHELSKKNKEDILGKVNQFLMSRVHIEQVAAASIYLLIQQEDVNKEAYSILLNAMRDMEELEQIDWRFGNYLYVNILSLKEPFKFEFLLKAIQITSSSNFATGLVSRLLDEYELINRYNDIGTMQNIFNMKQKQLIETIIESDAFWQSEKTDQILSWAKIQPTRDGLKEQLENSTVE